MLHIGGLIPSTIATTVANSDLYFVWCPSILEVYVVLSKITRCSRTSPKIYKIYNKHPVTNWQSFFTGCCYCS